MTVEVISSLSISSLRKTEGSCTFPFFKSNCTSC
jgi:hypothetical protein